MELNLAGKVVVVTGGGSGIGKATALEFAKEGCKVAICGRRQERLEAVQEELIALGCEAFTGVMDVRDVSAIKSFAKDIYDRFGHLDVWVNNAGDHFDRRMRDLTEEDWNYMVDINMKAVFFASQAAAYYMMEQKTGGVIINISSFGAIIPSPARAVYCASKAAVSNLTQSFAAEYAPFGIRAFSVLPGATNTEMNMRVRGETGPWTADIALARPAKPEEMAKPIVFLASEAAGYITGSGIVINGGKFCVQKPGESWKER